MAETTGERPPSKARDAVIDEAKRLEERTRDSSKGHYNAADDWKDRNLWFGIPTVILSTIIGATVFSKYAAEYPVVAIISGALSIVVAILSAITTFLNPNDQRSAHFMAANAYDQLSNEARIFWSIECWQEENTTILTARLRDLVDRKDKLNNSCPQIPKAAYEKAKKGVADGEATYEVDKLLVDSRPAPDQPPGNRDNQQRDGA